MLHIFLGVATVLGMVVLALLVVIGLTLLFMRIRDALVLGHNLAWLARQLPDCSITRHMASSPSRVGSSPSSASRTSEIHRDE